MADRAEGGVEPPQPYPSDASTWVQLKWWLKNDVEMLVLLLVVFVISGLAIAYRKTAEAFRNV